MEDWRPFNEAHSIRVAGLTVGFAQELTDIPWSKVVAEGKTRAHSSGLTVDGPPVPVIRLVHQAGPALVQMDRAEYLRLRTPTFAVEKMAFDRSSLHYENWDYTRWSAFLDRAGSLLFGTLGDTYLGAVPFRTLAVDYFDSFVSLEGVELPNVGHLVREDSGYVAGGAFQASAPWQVQSGWTLDVDGANRTINVGIEVVDMTGTGQPRSATRMVNIRTSVTDSFDRPGALRPSNDGVDVAFLQGRCNMMHIELKRLIGAILTEQAARAVGLRAEVA